MLRFGSHDLEMDCVSYVVSHTVGAIFNPISSGDVEDSTFLLRNPRLPQAACVRKLEFNSGSSAGDHIAALNTAILPPMRFKS